MLTERRFNIRRAAVRALSTPCTFRTPRTRYISISTPSILRQVKPGLAHPLQLRLISDATTQGEPEADGAVQQHGENSIAASTSDAIPESSASATTVSTESTDQQEQSTAATESTDQQEQSTVASAIQSAVDTTTAKASETTISDPTPGPTSDPLSQVYVGNLFFDITEDTLRREFERFGSITTIKVVSDERGLSKGFGYIEFSVPESALLCIREMNQQIFEGRRLVVQYATKKKGFMKDPDLKNQPSKTLFIGNMSFEMTDQDLNDLFREIRNVKDVRVAIDRRTGQPRGFAHADFDDVESAVQAMEQLDGKEIYGRLLRVDYGENNATRRSNVSARRRA